MALRLKRLGIARVRPLAGGIEAWHARRFPVVPWARVVVDGGDGGLHGVRAEAARGDGPLDQPDR